MKKENLFSVGNKKLLMAAILNVLVVLIDKIILNSTGALGSPPILTTVLWYFIFKNRKWAYYTYTTLVFISGLFGLIGIVIFVGYIYRGYNPYAGVLMIIVAVSYLASWCILRKNMKNGTSAIRNHKTVSTEKEKQATFSLNKKLQVAAGVNCIIMLLYIAYLWYRGAGWLWVPSAVLTVLLWYFILKQKRWARYSYFALSTLIAIAYIKDTILFLQYNDVAGSQWMGLFPYMTVSLSFAVCSLLLWAEHRKVLLSEYNKIDHM